MFVLAFTTGPLAGQRVEMRSDITLGRQSTDIVIDYPEVSRRHAAVRPVEDALEIEDLGSLNGTIVNHLPISRSTMLRSGDVIEIGGTHVHVVEEPDPDATVVRERPLLEVPAQDRPRSGPPMVTDSTLAEREGATTMGCDA